MLTSHDPHPQHPGNDGVNKPAVKSSKNLCLGNAGQTLAPCCLRFPSPAFFSEGRRWEGACLGDFAFGTLLSVTFLACTLAPTHQDGAWRSSVKAFILSEEFPSLGKQDELRVKRS